MPEHTIVSTDAAPAPTGHYSQGAVYGDLVFTCGLVGVDPATGALAQGVGPQTTQTLKNLAAVLAAAGSDWSRVLKVLVFLDDIETFDEFNAAYSAFVEGTPPPRSTVGGRLAGDLLVEIECVAYRG
jgi:2-iminobutanoate/2-iminopropanoate deaminase